MRKSKSETRILKKDLIPHLREIGEFLKIERKKTGMSQAALADASGVGTHMNIARYESGLARIPLENIKPIAEALKIDPLTLANKVLPTYGLDYLPTSAAV